LEDELTVSRLIGPLTEEEKAAVRAEILENLIAHGPVSGTRAEIRTILDLEEIPMGLFNSSCWHLAAGDRDEKGRRHIRVSREFDADRHGMHAGRPFIITPLHS